MEVLAAVKASYLEELPEIGRFFQNSREHHHHAAILSQRQVLRLLIACESGRKRCLKDFDHLCSGSAGLLRRGHFQNFADPLICHAATHRDLEV